MHGISLPWITRANGAPYFRDDAGQAWTPVGHNDAMSWPHMRRLFDGSDPARVERHLAMLARSGVTCLRMMMEYAQHREHYLEHPQGVFAPRVVAFWDALLPMLERHGLRLLWTPYDTYWMWVRWRSHPYNARNGGSVGERGALLTCPAARAAIKQRLSFAVERWGGSGVIFAWDLWNEIHPAHAGESADGFMEFIADLSAHVRAAELRHHGRAHLQTVSLFGPELVWRAHMPLREPIFRHPDLDFATIHIYEGVSIDAPRNTVDGAAAMGRIVEECMAEIGDTRPFLDSEHGPIHSYKDKRRTLPAAFDDEYFRHMQWAHLAAGGAGGGMRWPNRSPHVLTRGMHQAQQGLAGFLPLIDWPRFARASAGQRLRLTRPGRRGPLEVGKRRVIRFASASPDQAVAYLLRRDRLLPDGRVDADAPPLDVTLELPGLLPGRYAVTVWDTLAGRAVDVVRVSVQDGALTLRLPLVTDMALAVVRERG
jgi:mannan endo-1,4-beta-mannosidase